MIKKSILFFLVLSLLFGTIVLAVTVSHTIQGDFDKGQYNDTHYNTTGGFVQLNDSKSSGNYTSESISGGGNVQWDMIYWFDNTNQSAWYNSSWSSRKTVEVNNYDSVALTNYSIEVFVEYDSNMQADFDDLRFTDSDGVTELYYWVDDYLNNSGANATIWVTIPSLSASAIKNIYLYYGNADVSTASNGTLAFEFFYDFDNVNAGATDSAKWTLGGEGGCTSSAVVDMPDGTNGRARSRRTCLNPHNIWGVSASDITFNEGKELYWRLNSTWTGTSGRIGRTVVGIYATTVTSFTSEAAVITTNGNYIKAGLGRLVKTAADANLVYNGRKKVSTSWSDTPIGCSDPRDVYLNKNVELKMHVNVSGMVNAYVKNENETSWGLCYQGSDFNYSGGTYKMGFSSAFAASPIAYDYFDNAIVRGSADNPPIVTVTDLKFQVRSDADNVSWGNFLGPDGTTTSYYSNLTGQALNVSDAKYIQYIAFFETDNSSNIPPVIYNVTVEYTILDALSPELTINSPANNSNISNNYVEFNFTVTDNVDTALLCNLTLNGTQTQSNSSSLNNSVTILNETGMSSGVYPWRIDCLDDNSNSNVSDNYTLTLDAVKPIIEQITLVGANSSIDPNLIVNVTTNVTDDYIGLDAVVLQWKMVNESSYNNVTMTGNGTTNFFNGSFTPPSNNSYEIKIIANDTFGNVNASSSFFVIEYESSWDSPSSMATAFGQQNQVKEMGLFYINNTGDGILSITTLTSNFGLTFNESTPFNLSAKETRYVNASGTFSASVRDDDVIIYIGAEILTGLPTPSPTNSTLNFTVSTISPGPYLSTVIGSGDSLVSQSGTKEYIGYTENVGNESVLNVTLNWTIPTGSSLSSGSLSTTTSSLAAGIKLYNNITLLYGTNIPYDPNATTQLILNGTSDSNTSSSASLNLTVLCNGGDGVCGTSCTEASDSDCKVGGGTSTGGGGGGGSSGGGGGGSRGGFLSSKTVFKTQTTEEVTLVRGKSNEFKLDISNIQEGSVIKDTTVEVTGFLSKYIKVSPSKLTDIGFGQTKYFTVEINAPRYLEESDYALEALIQSSVLIGGQMGSITDKRIINLFIKEESEKDIDLLILNAENALNEMKSNGIPITINTVLLEKARSAYSKGKLKLASELANKILANKEKGFLVQKEISEFEEKIDDAHEKGLDVSSTEQLFNVAMDAFEREDFDISLQSLNQAQLTYILEIKKELNILKFAANYWWAIILGLFALLAISYFYYTKIIIAIANYRIKNLTKESEVIHGLLKKNQSTYYDERAISSHEFSKNQKGYENRLSEIQQIKTKLRTKRVGIIISNRKEMKKVLKEKLMVTDNLKDLQNRYYKEKAITRTEFDGSNKIIKTRLVELEEDESILEAKIAAEKQNKKGKIKMALEDIFNKIIMFFKDLKSEPKPKKKKTPKGKIEKTNIEKTKKTVKIDENGKFSDFRDKTSGFIGQVRSGMLRRDEDSKIFGYPLTKKRIESAEVKETLVEDIDDENLKGASPKGAYEILRKHGVKLEEETAQEGTVSNLKNILGNGLRLVSTIKTKYFAKKEVEEHSIEDEEKEIRSMIKEDIKKSKKKEIRNVEVRKHNYEGAYEILRKHGIKFNEKIDVRKNIKKVTPNKESIVGRKKESIVEDFKKEFVKKSSNEPKKTNIRVEQWRKERVAREKWAVDRKRKNNSYLEDVKGVLDDMGVDYGDEDERGKNK